MEGDDRERKTKRKEKEMSFSNPSIVKVMEGGWRNGDREEGGGRMEEWREGGREPENETKTNGCHF